MIYSLAFLIGGIGGRIRGGLLKDLLPKLKTGTGFGRIVGWVIPVTLVLAYKTGEWMLAPHIAILAYLGVAIGYLGAQFGLIHPENRTLKNYAILTVRGAFICTPLLGLAINLPAFHSVYYGILAGLLFVPCYLLGNLVWKWFKFFSPSQWGEFFIYGSILGALSW